MGMYTDESSRTSRARGCERSGSPRARPFALVVGLVGLAGAPSIGAQQSDFPESEGPFGDGIEWRLSTTAGRVRLDDAAARTGRQSLRVEASASRGEFSGRVADALLPGERVRIDAYFRRADREAAPGLWVRVAGDRGLIYVDRVFAESAAETDPEPDGWRRLTIEAPVSRLAREIRFGFAVGGTGAAWFDDVSAEVVALEEHPPASSAARGYIDRALEILERHSLRRESVDWRALRSAAYNQARGARSPADARLAVQFAVGELNDGHSYFMSPRQMSRLEDESPVSNARTGRPVVAPSGELLASGAAYVRVPGFAGGSHRAQAAYAASLQALVADLESAGACGWIVDLRDNRGGNLWPMLAGLGPLLGEGSVAAAVYPDATREAIWYRDGKAGLGDYVRLRVHAPYSLGSEAASVAVLTNGSTASAAEILAAAFAGEANVRSFGTPTRGAHSGTRVFPLSDGSALVLAVAATSDRRGELLHGPIVPDEPTGSTDTAGGRRGQSPAVEAAEHWLTAQAQCSALALR